MKTGLKYRQRLRKFPARPQQGFSLIELMVVVAIIAIISLIALPQYQRFAAKSKVAAALAELTAGKIGAEALLAAGQTPDDHDPRSIGLPGRSSERCVSFELIFHSTGYVRLYCELRDDPYYGREMFLSLQRDNETGKWSCAGTDGLDPSIRPEGCSDPW